MRELFLLVPLLAFSGCASTQLNYNAVDVTSSLQSVYTGQVLTNLSKLIDDQNAIPSQADISASQIQTANSISPSITFPLSNSVATAAGVTTTRTSTIAGASMSLMASGSWQQSYTVTPVSDSNVLRNLRALYRHAVFATNLKSEYHIPLTYDSKGNLVPDLYFLKRPQCIICEATQHTNPDEAPAAYAAAQLNERLARGAWLYWKSDLGSPTQERLPSNGEAIVSLGHYGTHELLMLKSDYENGVLADFILFVLPQTEPSKGAVPKPASRGPLIPFSLPLTPGPIQ